MPAAYAPCSYALAKNFGRDLIYNCREVVGQPPPYKDGVLYTTGFPSGIPGMEAGQDDVYAYVFPPYLT